MDILNTISTRHTPQIEKADPRQVKNAAGGYTFTVDDSARLHRFLTLGTDGGTYYASAKELTKDAAAVVFRAAASDPVELVRHIVEVSEAGRAPKNNQALFALAIAAACDDVVGRQAAMAALPRVARTATHLFQFVGYVEQFRGWGPALRRAVGDWYNDKPVDKLAYQLVKYRQREGWTHRDVLRLAHPTPTTPERDALYGYAVRGLAQDESNQELPGIVRAFEMAQHTTHRLNWLTLLRDYPSLSWEMLPDAALNEPDVWEALIANGMPQTALMRQLPRLTRLGVLTGQTGAAVAHQLQDAEKLKRGRVHPVNVLVAQRTYASGVSARGDSTWSPVSKITDALDAAFYAAYGAVEPSNKRTLLALDVSGSMGSSVSGLPLSCREAASALALVTAAVEPEHRIVGFTAQGGRSVWGGATVLQELDISPRRRLDDVLRYTSQLPFGRTDCALPMVWALKNRVPIDVFHVYTDNETYYGSIHPHQALRAYRERTGIDARLVVVAMTATGSSIADPSDPGQLDVSGFDSAVPNLLSDFARGEL